MNCRRCGEEMQENWNYCPKCGERLKPVFSPLTAGHIRVNIIQPQPAPANQPVIEPESEILQEEDGVKLKIKLPGVTNPGSVFIRKVGESLEVNANASGKRYFKIVNLEKLGIIKQTFQDETLTLTLG